MSTCTPEFRGQSDEVWPALAEAVRSWCRDPMPKFRDLEVVVLPDPISSGPVLALQIRLTSSIHNCCWIVRRPEGNLPAIDLRAWVHSVLDSRHWDLVSMARAAFPR